MDFSRVRLEPGSWVLDVGSGPGRHSWESFRMPGVNVVAVDSDPWRVGQARYMLGAMVVNGESGGGTASVCVADACRLPFRDDAFDAVICSEVLEHIPDDHGAAQELARVLKPGGTAVVSVPGYLPERICWMLSRRYPEMAENHLRIYRRADIEDVCRGAGFTIRETGRAHAMHSPLWWLRCLADKNAAAGRLSDAYHRFLTGRIARPAGWNELLERCLNPFFAKSLVLYLEK
ncbi:MAG: class I SAM-dependent methyltransferase [Desulfatibacillaceae bacterium]